MGLTSRNRFTKSAYVWYWRARYWWMDTESGRVYHVALFCLMVLLTILQSIKLAVAAVVGPPAGAPVGAYYWVVQIIIAIVMAVISYALRPKIEGVQPSNQAAPTVEDGQGIHEAHGDVWIEDQFINAQRVVGQEPIKSKGKK